MPGGVVYRQRSKKHKNRDARQGGKYDNACNTRRYNGHRKRGYYPNVVRAAPLDGRKNESKKMVASKL